MRAIVILLLLFPSLAFAQATAPFSGFSPYKGDTHVHPGHAANHRIYYDGIDVSKCVGLDDPVGCCDGAGSDTDGDCDNVEANIASWTCTGSTPTGTGLNTPAYGVPHSMGGPLSTCEVYRNLGFDFAALTPHHEKSCRGAGCNGDYRNDTLTWWTAPGNQGIDSAWPLDQTRVPLWNEECGFRDFVAGAGNCVSPPEDEMLSMMTGAARSSIDHAGSFVCLGGHEWNGGNTNPTLQAACLAAAPKVTGLKNSFGHMNIIYPDGREFVSNCIRSNSESDSEYCYGEGDVFAEARATGAVLTKNHPSFLPSDDNPATCGCTSWTLADGCSTSFVPRDESINIAGWDDREIDLIEAMGATASGIGATPATHGTHHFDSVLYAWNLGLSPGVTYGSDNHGNSCTALKEDPEADGIGAAYVWARELTSASLTSGMKSRRTYVTSGFSGTGARAEFWAEEGSATATMGEFLAVDDGTASFYAEIRNDDAYVTADSVGNKFATIRIMKADPSWVPGVPGTASTGLVFHTCDVATPGAGCTCTATDADNGCTIATANAAVTDGWYYAEAFDQAGDRKLMTSAIWINRCDYIVSKGTDVPCIRNGGLLANGN